MGELMEYFKERYMKSSNNSTKDLMQKQKVKNAVLKLCDEYIKDSDDIFTFEIVPSDLQYAAEIVDEEPLRSKYQIVQISDTLFTAKLRELYI